jgi:hypothetical protein
MISRAIHQYFSTAYISGMSKMDWALEGLVTLAGQNECSRLYTAVAFTLLREDILPDM